MGLRVALHVTLHETHRRSGEFHQCDDSLAKGWWFTPYTRFRFSCRIIYLPPLSIAVKNNQKKKIHVKKILNLLEQNISYLNTSEKCIIRLFTVNRIFSVTSVPVPCVTSYCSIWYYYDYTKLLLPSSVNELSCFKNAGDYITAGNDIAKADTHVQVVDH